ncbi:phage tail tube protein [Zavarzinia sp.]|uniref:phage tail tube protein n=1 Tax=Zavarzinia sp. TaxID=2027920 RepID=UPI003BB5F8E7
MAQAVSIKFGLIALMLGDGATPTEVFEAPCGVTSLTVTTNVETNTTNIPDCEDPDLASWLAIDEISRQKQVSGGGLLAQASADTWNEWDLAGGYKNVRVYTNLSAANGGGYLVGPALLTAYEQSGERGQRWQNSFTITFDGKPTWVPAV